jgi:hypothetical protein
MSSHYCRCIVALFVWVLLCVSAAAAAAAVVDDGGGSASINADGSPVRAPKLSKAERAARSRFTRLLIAPGDLDGEWVCACGACLHVWVGALGAAAAPQRCVIAVNVCHDAGGSK